MRRTAIALLAGIVLLPCALFAQGGVDFSRYVALGDSLTAGFASGGLAIDSQQGSYPRILHFQATGGDQFEQPLISDPGLPAQLRLASLAPVLIVPKAGQGHPLNLNLPRPYDNLGVPGARVHDTLATVTDHGGMHDLVLRGLGTAVQEAAALHPTFVTLWIGNNDVLAAATSGIVIEGVTLTPAAAFEHDYRAIAGALAATGAKMALATIPRVTAIPFVTTIPPVVVNPATNEPVLINGQTVPLIGPNGPLGANDRVLLSAQAELAQGKGIPVALGGTGQPLSNSAVLDAGEVAAIQNRADQFNGVIRAVAGETGSALVDVEAIFDRIAASGYSAGGVRITKDFLTGGLFSYDGVHPSPFGYGLIAQEFLTAINRQFRAHIPGVNLYQILTSGGAIFAPVSAPDARAATLADRALDNLRRGLNIPSRDQLERLAARAGQGGGGSHQGGNGGSGRGSRHHRGGHRHGRR
jgi:lysophospholipase L1-like esterase